jgi:ligand-binding sensor domain-containing protein
MRTNKKCYGLAICLIWLLRFSVSGFVPSDLLFSPIKASDGLSDNQIRYILQLPDGRMVFTTSGNINIYDGFRFQYIHRVDEDISILSKYDGHYHIYQSKDSLLWIKDQYKLMCIDLTQEQYVTHPDSLFIKMGVSDPVQDIFIDNDLRLWLLTDRGLIHPKNSLLINEIDKEGKLQDVTSSEKLLFLFYHTGVVVCYDLKTGKKLYRIAAYPAHEIPTFQRTSLVVKGKNGFYQLRNGSKGGFFHFNPQTRSWKTLFETDYTLNTLIITADELAYISCVKGLWKIDLGTGEQHYHPSLNMVDGSTVSTEMSTLFYDQQGGFWVGTFNRGLLYYHPSRYSFQRIDQSMTQQSAGDEFRVESIAESKDGTIYLRSKSNFYQYDDQNTFNAKLKLIQSSVIPKDALNKLNQPNTYKTYRNKDYSDLHKDSRGWIWGGTSDGLELFKSEKSLMFHSEDGLVNNFTELPI